MPGAGLAGGQAHPRRHVYLPLAKEDQPAFIRVALCNGTQDASRWRPLTAGTAREGG